MKQLICDTEFRLLQYLKGGNIYIHVDKFAEYMVVVYITSKEDKDATTH